ncbi:MAG: hypothetical protein HC772_14160 [Leptolyngbyaceae cyanobacterium CRU_2_3]|nr:hypothetical protein [Leptolyngbyaceae cyanobacterium CRU_2_3]
METPLSERLLVVLLTLVTLGSIVTLTYTLVAAELTSAPANAYPTLGTQSP